MDMTTANYSATFRPKEFTYILTSFDNGRKFHVSYEGVIIGDVANYSDNPSEWYATFDSGNADSLRWIGGFRSRMEASTFLLGAKMAVDREPVHTNKDGSTTTRRSAYTGVVW